MNILIVDMTHGGVLIVSEFSKMDNCSVFAYDIYKTLSDEKKSSLVKEGVKFVDETFLDKITGEYDNETELEDEILIIAPVHCNIQSKVHITHHEAVKLLLKDKINVPVMEVTGVKGKTSVVWMLKEIFKNSNPLILSSLGVEVAKNGIYHVLKRNLSITPASILESWLIAGKCNPEICIFETSLGGTGLADVGVLTNIAENYPIASGGKTASEAKEQIFKSKLIVCDFDSFNKYYSMIDANVNTFGLNNSANVNASKINFGLDRTTFSVNIRDLKTLNGEILNISFELETFAPAEHHLLNVLCVICSSLSLNTPVTQIVSGLKQFKGVEGRTSIRNYEDSIVIEEINPGINVTAVRKSVKMIEKYESPTVIFGGKYGVTCEEIDEDQAAEFFNNMDERIQLILVDELGKNMEKLIKRKYKYTGFNNAIGEAVSGNSKIILLIYRSNFSDISKR
ncbi:coenzyme F430 synthase [Methanobacterium sp. ACI-7]|uniref:coenzyme F430 synthase n=1 Tax=unclassified Methanobacterium TaxID=2627676 RepID=UPI0039C48692